MIPYRYGISIWNIDVGDRISISYGYEYRYGIRDLDLGDGISIWSSTISIWSSVISMWDMGC